MNDLISRKAALDIFKPWLDVKGYSEGELNMLRAVIYELETIKGEQRMKIVYCDKCGEQLNAYHFHMTYSGNNENEVELCEKCATDLNLNGLRGI